MRVMIMAAGVGTRLRPLTDLVPKPMAPIVNRPALHHILRLLGRHGLTEVVINLHHLPNTITGHFGDGTQLGMDITYSFEPELLGTAGGVKNNAGFLGGGTFLVMSGVGSGPSPQGVTRHAGRQRSGRSQPVWRGGRR
jgi:NDP-sugar pyrophosphorylase family protein